MKVTVTIVAVKPERRAPRSERFPRPVAGIDEKQVSTAVVGDVDDSNPTAHRLGQQFLAVRAVVMHEVDARRFGHVGKPRRWNGDRRSGRRRGCFDLGFRECGLVFWESRDTIGYQPSQASRDEDPH